MSVTVRPVDSLIYLSIFTSALIKLADAQSLDSSHTPGASRRGGVGRLHHPRSAPQGAPLTRLSLVCGLTASRRATAYIPRRSPVSPPRLPPRSLRYPSRHSHQFTASVSVPPLPLASSCALPSAIAHTFRPPTHVRRCFLISSPLARTALHPAHSYRRSPSTLIRT